MDVDRIPFDIQLFAGEKTEQATPRKREDARKKGQVAKSQEVSTAFLLLGAAATLYLTGGTLFVRLQHLVQHFLSTAGTWDGDVSDVQTIYLFVLNQGLLVLTPIFLVLTIIAASSQGLQVGLRLTGEKIAPKLSKINPLEGLKRIFSKRAITEFLKALIKIGIVAGIVYWQLSDAVSWLPGLNQMDIGQGLQLVAQQAFTMAIWIGIALLAVAGLDYLYQRWEFEESIKMTKQEVKDEHKQSEGDPIIRSKLKQKQRQLAEQRMMESVPEADVVVTNPIHYAVALAYKAEEMNAPMVVAKGAGTVAERIKALARQHNIEIVENPPLAQALFKLVDVGRPIPADLYASVAEVLAFVYRLRRKTV